MSQYADELTAGRIMELVAYGTFRPMSDVDRMGLAGAAPDSLIGELDEEEGMIALISPDGTVSIIGGTDIEGDPVWQVDLKAGSIERIL